MERLDFGSLPTESQNPHSARLDKLTPRGLVRVMNAEDFNAARAVKKAAREIAQVMLWAAQAYQSGHKIIFTGAGTSGRLGILEAAECVPTFGTRPSEIIALLAGGKRAVFKAREGAEDDAAQGAREMKKVCSRGDLVIGLTASGRTPYVFGGLQAAQQAGAKTALLCCNRQADTLHADGFIFLDTGAEVLTGSTRLKAGTATKMALNIITTGAMTLCGKTYGNLMIDVRPSNKKLNIRAVNLIRRLTGIGEKEAAALLQTAGRRVKTAVVMRRKGVTRRQAENLLKKSKGFLAHVIDE